MEGAKRCPNCLTEIASNPDPNKHDYPSTKDGYEIYIHICHICGENITVNRVKIMEKKESFSLRNLSFGSK